ncbi:Putative NADH:flavin oxidoreductase/NADH oxidase, aldolase-type TIM barrel, oxidoreductase Oye [Septoria linicola]|uniref:NADH:flavin oxidoreductase/NADH oxidase, aldolase-type TIM barrel, oxidoreductase Oye n=1 Tax=Septoria linicola TaxID=215465 RepID=A0A9Q9AL22_9PEZI|nr:Putative NADH:flavin oxidoreductase/NADH oxidase, aldolase-type TIM barrel, oxidoreductase Oye [Septoria linicola]
MGSAPPTSKLFEPVQLGNVKLSTRIALAPLTRFRAEDDHVILPLAQTYYEQRGCVPGTLLISEATLVSKQAGGYQNVPGIYTQEQIDAWKAVTKSVHSKGSYIYLQLWALGRVADPKVKQAEDSSDVVSSSAVPYQEGATVPRELNENEIQQYIKDYASAAKNAIEAGFDGVEIHAANGYLIDQFTQDTCNQRTDQWGGSVENRARFAIEVTKAVVQAVGSKRTGIRLSPFSDFQGMKMQDPVPQFNYLVEQLKGFQLAYLHLVESRISGNADIEATEKVEPFIQTYGTTSPILLAGGFKPDSAKRAVDEEFKDNNVVVVFGRYFIPNPDLVYRIQNDIPLTQYDRSTFYKPKAAEGYIDWEFSEQFKKEHKL